MKHFFRVAVLAILFGTTVSCSRDNDDSIVEPQPKKEENIPPKRDENIPPKKEENTPPNYQKAEYAEYLPNIFLKTNPNPTAKQYIDETNKAYTEYKRLEKELDKYSELPNDDFYNLQKNLWDTHLRLANPMIEAYAQKTQNTEISSLKKSYIDIYTYVLGYAYIELLCRRAETYRKEFPNDELILNLIKNMTSSNYGTQEGSEFVVGLNNETVAVYNKIVDRVNELRKAK